MKSPLSVIAVMPTLVFVPLNKREFPLKLGAASVVINSPSVVAVVLPLSPPSSDTFVIAELALTLSSESKATSTSTSSELLRIRTASPL